MRKKLIAQATFTIAALLTSMQLAAEEIIIDQNAKKTQAFVLMQAEMVDMDMFFNQYAVHAEKVVNAYGGIARIGTFDKNIFEGSWDNNWTLMLNFPSLEIAKNWYYSPDYQALIPYRQAASAYGNMIAFEGTPESLLQWRVDTYSNRKPVIEFPGTLDTNPEFIVTLKPQSIGKDRFSVDIEFDEKNLLNSKLSLALRLGEEATNDLLVTQYFAVDIEGHETLLGANMIYSGSGWTEAEFKIPSHHLGATHLKKANHLRVKFDLRSRDESLPSILIKNLRVSRKG